MHRIRALIVMAGLMAVPLVSSAQTTTNYTYDDLGRLKTVSYPSGTQSAYNYDLADNRTSATTGVPGANQAPVCSARTISFAGTPPNMSIPSFVFNPITINPPCTDADGNTMSLVSITAPATMGANNTATVYNITPGYNVTLSYTISDGNGGTTTSTITIIRP
jgi:YD repeat-containing protein